MNDTTSVAYNTKLNTVVSDDDEDDEDDDDVVLVETVPGTGRSVRVLQGLELFFCTLAVLVVTFKALQQYAGVSSSSLGGFFALQSKPIMADAAAESSASSSSSSFMLWSFKA
jgi:hypothetical protein